jgi:hypothetical protein
MRTLARRLFALCSAASLVILLAAVTFAVRGVWRSEWVGHSGDAGIVVVASGGSTASFNYWDDVETAPIGWNAGSVPRGGPYWSPLPDGVPDWLGLSLYTGRTDPSTRSRFGGNRPYVVLVLPHWMAALAAAVLPAAWFRRRLRRWRQRAPGLCRACGYDLRASPGRCPECGAPADVST